MADAPANVGVRLDDEARVVRDQGWQVRVSHEVRDQGRPVLSSREVRDRARRVRDEAASADGSDVAERVAEGAASGALATLAMSGLMLAAGRLGLMGRYPPERLASFTLARLGVGPLQRWKVDGPAAAALHLVVGGTLGAAFGLVPRRVRRAWPEPLAGAAFGTLVWLTSYWGLIPTLGLLPPPDRDRPGRPVSMLVAHWVYGAALGAALLAIESGWLGADRR